MPEAHVPHLDHHDGEHTDAPATVSAPARRWKTLPKLLLEVLLITTGVFLGLLGEQWRGNSERRELGTRCSSCSMVAHLADHTKPIPTPVPDTVTDSAGVEFSAWDVALATASLAYIDPTLVAEMSGALATTRCPPVGKALQGR